MLFNRLGVVCLHKACSSQANENATCFVYTSLAYPEFASKRQATESSIGNILFTEEFLFFKEQVEI